MKRIVVTIIMTLSLLTAWSSVDSKSDESVSKTDASAVGEQIKWQVVGGGGTEASSASYKLRATVVQTATVPVASAGYKTSQGYWYPGVCCFREGDFNHNGTVNVVDVTAMVAYLFQGGAIYACKEEADCNDNGSVNVVDLTTLVAYLFSGGSIGVCP